MSTARAVLDEHITESDFLTNIVALAHLSGWLVHHTRPARTTKGWVTPIQGDPGLPDLILVKDRRLIFAEVKAQRGRMSDGQIRWVGMLDTVAEGTDLVDVFVWRPTDWPEIVEVLT